MPALDLETSLNDEQRDVVLHGDGPVLVLAGAGSGKTRAITYRVAHLLSEGVLPQEILLLTFTNKAAREMTGRIERLCGEGARGLWSGTFHSVAHKMLRRFAPELGFSPSFTILDGDDSELLIRTCLKEVKPDAAETRFPSAAVIHSMVSFGRNSSRTLREVVEENYVSWAPLTPTLEEIAKRYTEKKRMGNLMDFDDLLCFFHELLETHAQVAHQLAEQFRYVLVDEFQDTNLIQGAIVRRLASLHKNILVVGDDAQSIYAFRGATVRNILDFPTWFAGTRTFHLTANYRSAPEILSLANASITHNTEQYEKTLRAMRASAARPSLVATGSPLQEAKYLSAEIDKQAKGGTSLREMAVLFRSAFHSQQLEMELVRLGIPYEYRGGLRFFERAHVKDILAYLRIRANVQDEPSWLRVLSHQAGIGPVTASSVFARVRHVDSWERVFEEPLSLPPRAGAGWNGYLRVARDLSREALPAEMIRAVARSDYQEYMRAQYPDAAERLEDIEQFALFAESFDTLVDFLAEVTLHDDYEAARQTGAPVEDRLVLSTIHQAKGLEWDHVFLMRLQDGSFPHRRALEDRDAIEEERRLFYVAVTRARHRLTLTYPLTDGTESYFVHQPSMFLSEVPRALFEEVRLRSVPAASLPRRDADGYEEPTIVLDTAGERASMKKAPVSFLRDV
ncbi:ATP-dependent helicase [Candidatus Uhrbacteria bacterium]|nr:ATP-dependent helicase [Candidatus Uhrbacteria bacterium]